mgnify:CR=1 FL=1
MKKKTLYFIIPLIIVVVLICLWLYFNTGLKGFEKEVSDFELPENVEKIALKSGIGDSGGNGDYSTYRVVLVVKTKMSMQELNEEFENRNMTFSSHIVNGDTPICYITRCENSVFKSAREFTLEFEELESVEDFSDYYFIEFIK